MPTKIEWTHPPGYKGETWNPVTGCTPISEGCKNCYAQRWLKRGLYKYGPEVTLHPDRLDKPLHWKKPRFIFACSMGDLFHPDVPDDFVTLVIRRIAEFPRHIFIVLTKRPERMAAWFDAHWRPDVFDNFKRAGTTYRRPRLFLRQAGCSECRFHFLGCLRGRKEWKDEADSPHFRDTGKKDFFGHEDMICDGFEWLWASEGHGIAVKMDTGEISVRQQDLVGPFPAPLKNLWLGVVAENQEQADKRIPILLEIPAVVRFVSVEPMLGPVDLVNIGESTCGILREGALRPLLRYDALRGFAQCGGSIEKPQAKLEWVICGGESGPGARPMHPDWARGLRDQCKAAGVPFFFKQWGEYLPAEAGNLNTHLHARMTVQLAGDGQSEDVSQWLKVGKKAAGRLLDGVEYNEYPAGNVK